MYKHVATGTKVRITIRSNSYASQHYARAEVLDGKEMCWNCIADIPHHMMKTSDSLEFKKDNKDEKHFVDDLSEMLRQVEMLLE
jgi:hypothetical protein